MRKRLLLLAVLVAALIAGCGVPRTSGVFIDGPASAGRGAGSDAKPPPPGPNGINDPAIFVEKYLGAIAGKSESDTAGLSAAATAFMSDATKRAWHMTKQITVVRAVATKSQWQQSTGAYDVSWQVQVLGIFTPSQGTLQLAQAGTPQHKTLNFHVLSLVNDQGGRLLQFTGAAPDGLYLSEDALFDYYRQQPVYFWDSSGEVLIPELRYLPLTVSPLQQETTLVNWVLGGPTEALGSAAKALVTTTLLDPQVSQDGGRLVIDLAQPSAHFDQSLPSKLAIQLRWSLLDMGPGGSGPPDIELLIDRQRQSVVEDEGSTAAFRAANPISSNSVPVEYAIGNGVVRPLDGEPAAILDASANSNVISAAVGRNQASAALVRAINGHYELWWRPSLKAPFKMVAGGGSMSRPDIFGGGVFVIVDGKLKYVGAGHDQVISVPGVAGLSDLAIAPDGRRFALVAGGQLYTSALSWQNDVASMTPARQLRTKLESVVTVAWSSQSDLAIGGLEGGEHVLKETNSDGADNSPLVSLGSVAASSVSAYPFDPVNSAGRTSIIFESGGVASRVGPGGVSVPLAWGTSAGGDQGKPQSPFFGD